MCIVHGCRNPFSVLIHMCFHFYFSVVSGKDKGWNNHDIYNICMLGLIIVFTLHGCCNPFRVFNSCVCFLFRTCVPVLHLLQHCHTSPRHKNRKRKWISYSCLFWGTVVAIRSKRQACECVCPWWLYATTAHIFTGHLGRITSNGKYHMPPPCLPTIRHV